MKTAISEACNNVVVHAYDVGTGPLEVELRLAADLILATVRDEGRGIPEMADPDEGVHGVGVPLIKALADEVMFLSETDDGTEVRMEFAGRRRGEALFTLPEEVTAEDGWQKQLAGAVVATLSPVAFLGPVLGRLARALAARARFSLDRFSDVYLVTDAIAAHAVATARSGRVAFSIDAEARRLEISVGPLAHGSSAAVRAEARVTEPESALLLLSDTVDGVPLAGGEMLRVVMTDAPRPAETV
jgi:hypothetical protein